MRRIWSLVTVLNCHGDYNSDCVVNSNISFPELFHICWIRLLRDRCVRDGISSSFNHTEAIDSRWTVASKNIPSWTWAIGEDRLQFIWVKRRRLRRLKHVFSNVTRTQRCVFITNKTLKSQAHLCTLRKRVRLLMNMKWTTLEVTSVCSLYLPVPLMQFHKFASLCNSQREIVAMSTPEV